LFPAIMLLACGRRRPVPSRRPRPSSADAAAPTAARKHRPDLFCPAPPVVPLSTSAAAS